MTNVIEVLETLGKTAFTAGMQPSEINAILNPLDLDADIQHAIFSKDTTQLEMLLGVRNKIVCMVNQPEPADAPLDEPVPDQDDDPEQNPQSIKVSA